MDTRQSEVQKKLKAAEDAIQAGDLNALQIALDASYKIDMEISYWAPPPGNYSYELGIPDDIEHKMWVTKRVKYISPRQCAEQLCLLAATTNQPEILLYLIGNFCLPITPGLMKEFLNILKPTLLNNMKNAQLSANVATDSVLKKRLFVSTYDVGLIIFKHFFVRQLQYGTPKSVHNIIQQVVNYLPSDTQHYDDFMRFSKFRIFDYGNIPLIKEFDSIFGYTSDKDFLKYFLRDMKEKRKILSEEQSYFYDEHLATPESIMKIDDKYNKLIVKVIGDVQDILSKVKGRSKSHFFSQSRLTMTEELSSKINAILAEKNKTSLDRVLAIVNLLSSTYNQICKKVNESWVQSSSKTANQILDTLKELCHGAGIQLKFDIKNDKPLSPIVLTMSERIKTNKRILQKSVGESSQLEKYQGFNK